MRVPFSNRICRVVRFRSYEPYALVWGTSWSFLMAGHLSNRRPTDFEKTTVTDEGIMTLHLVVIV